MKQHPIGVFDSGYGGLTVLKEIVALLPQYDYIYLGDNARAPYGTRSFETVYEYTWQSLQWFFNQGCQLVILACNTASAKALRSIQQNNLSATGPVNRVLGVIRPTAEVVGSLSTTKHIGLFATPGTVQSGSYPIEIGKVSPEITLTQEACPRWVPLIENNEHNSPDSNDFIEKHVVNLLNQDAHIDTILLACTHYPLLSEQIHKYLPRGIQLISQGQIVAASLKEYFTRHTNLSANLSVGGNRQFYTTGDVADFNLHAPAFYGEDITAAHIILP
ncbi:MAG: glutamate racemase [Ferruginibacter sp.]